PAARAMGQGWRVHRADGCTGAQRRRGAGRGDGAGSPRIDGLPRRYHAGDAGGPGPLIRAAPASQGPRKVKKAPTSEKGRGASCWLPAFLCRYAYKVCGSLKSAGGVGENLGAEPLGRRVPAPVKEMKVECIWFFVS